VAAAGLATCTSSLAAFVFGYWQDRLGHKRSLAGTIVPWIAVCLI
jgi:UMF1 family MFS transporter